MQRFDPSKEQYDHDALLNNFDAPQERNQTVIVTRQYTEMPSELTLDVESRGRMENPKHARVQSRIHTEKVRRYCCGCFSKRSTCCAVWLSIVFVILALLGVAGFLLYPRFPTLEISDPFSPPGSQGLQISPSGSLTDNLRNASPERPFSMSIPYAVNVSLYSPNYIDIYTSVMELKGNFLDSNGDPIPTFSGYGNVTNVVFKSKQKITFTLPVLIQYLTTAPVSLSSDQALLTLVSSCLSSNPPPLVFKYQVVVVIPLISWTGYKPVIRDRVLINCPSNVPQLLTNILNGGS